MVRRVAVQHRDPHPRRHLHAEARGHDAGDRLLREARVAKHRDHVLVAGKDPEAERTVMDGILGAQAVVGRIGIHYELGIHRIEVHVSAGPPAINDIRGSELLLPGLPDTQIPLS